MNNITYKQNEELQLQRLSAQRELYSSAKYYYYGQLVLNIVIPIGVSLIALFENEFRLWAAGIGSTAVLFDLFLLERIIKSRKSKAAKIQELFDCDVLELPKSPLKVADDVTVEDVLIHYHAHSKIRSNIEKIKNWYPVIVKSVPLHIARLICQRSNCYWDQSLRKKYLRLVVGLGILAVAFLVVGGIIKRLLLLDFILMVNALMPLFRFCIKQYYENRDGANRLKDLIKYMDGIWKGALSGEEDPGITEQSRRLQDEIFNHRTQNPLIPDFIYNWFRNADEKQMNKSAEFLINEYNTKNDRKAI